MCILHPRASEDIRSLKMLWTKSMIDPLLTSVSRESVTVRITLVAYTM